MTDSDRLVYRHRRRDERCYRTPDFRFYILKWDEEGNPIQSPLMSWWDFNRSGIEHDRDWEQVDIDWRLV
jgi:hypothetical protein